MDAEITNQITPEIPTIDSVAMNKEGFLLSGYRGSLK